MVDREQLKSLGWPDELIAAAEAVAGELRRAAPVPAVRDPDQVPRSTTTFDRVTIDERRTTSERVIRLEAPQVPPGRHRLL